MQDDAEVENPGRNHESRATTEAVGKEWREEGAKESTGREDGDNGGLLRRGDVALHVGVASAEEVLPVIHGENSTDRAGIIAVSIISRTAPRKARASWASAATYPNSTPPKATKKPMAMAGHVAPASFSGRERETFRTIPMIATICCELPTSSSCLGVG